MLIKSNGLLPRADEKYPSRRVAWVLARDRNYLAAKVLDETYRISREFAAKVFRDVGVDTVIVRESTLAQALRIAPEFVFEFCEQEHVVLSPLAQMLVFKRRIKRAHKRK